MVCLNQHKKQAAKNTLYTLALQCVIMILSINKGGKYPFIVKLLNITLNDI